MKHSRTIWALIAATIMVVGCRGTEPRATSVDAELSSEDSKLPSSPLTLTCVQTEVQDKVILTLRNSGKDPIGFLRYHFSLKFAVRKDDGTIVLLDNGADKVPVPSLSDWIVLKPSDTLTMRADIFQVPKGKLKVVEVDWDNRDREPPSWFAEEKLIVVERLVAR